MKLAKSISTLLTLFFAIQLPSVFAVEGGERVAQGVHAAAQKFLVVSDIDDTLKVSGTAHYYSAVLNVLNRDTFPGMSALYQELAKSAEKVFYLSASPQSMASRLQDILVVSGGFPAGQFLLSNWWKWESTFYYKLQQLNNLAEANDTAFLLVGDDVHWDPEIYEQFAKEVPTNRIIGTYIHQIGARPLPSSVSPFTTAYEIVLNEIEEGRLSVEQGLRVGKVILDSDRMDLVFPSYKVCPTAFAHQYGTGVRGEPALVSMGSQIETKIKNYCTKLARQRALTLEYRYSIDR